MYVMTDMRKIYWICALNIKMANALTKPIITARGMNFMNLAIFSIPHGTCKTPVKIVAANKYYIHALLTNNTIASAITPVAVEIIPGPPPTNVIMTAMLNKAYKPAMSACHSIPETKVVSISINSYVNV